MNRLSFTSSRSPRPIPEKAARGQFLPDLLRDAQGRRLVPADPREVERRLKARALFAPIICPSTGRPCPHPERCA